MRKDRFQNHISGSVFTLPVCAFIAFVLWWFPLSSEGGSLLGRLQFDLSHLIALGIIAFTSYVLIEMNNVNMLIRVRTRMVTSVWLLSVATIADTHVYSAGLTASCCMAMACYLLFKTYQCRNCQADSFHYALMIGLASIFVPHCIIFLPLFLWHQMAFLRSMSVRSLCASMVGFFFPALLWVSFWVYKDDYTKLKEWFETFRTYYPIVKENYLQLTYSQIASWGLVTWLTFLGAVHYLSTSYNDKIQVRMLLYAFVSMFFTIEVFVVLQPQRLDEMLPILLMVGAPLIAHFFALTKSWFTNFLFILSMMAYGALGYLNLFYQA